MASAAQRPTTRLSPRSAQAPRVAAPASVSILDPVDGDTVGGDWVEVDASGVIADTATSGEPTTLTLLVDGSAADSEDCVDGTPQGECDASLFWETSSAVFGAHVLEVSLQTASGDVATSADVHVDLAQLPAPAVSITSPAPGSVVSGPVTITATGSVDPVFGDQGQAMGLFIDGRLFGNVFDCPATGPCNASFPWDTSGLNGHFQLTVGFLTDQNFALSSPVGVTVNSPAPIVTLTLPHDPSRVVRGVTPVTLTGTIDPTQTDLAGDLQLYANGEPVGEAQRCLGGRSCTVTVPWDTTSLGGARSISLNARFDTVRAVAWSPMRYVDVGLDPAQPANLRVGVMGQTINGIDYAQVSVWDTKQLPVFDAVVTITVKPGTGAAYTVTATTTAPYGQAQVQLRGHVTSMLTAKLGSPDSSGASGSRKFIVQAAATCKLPHSVTHGRKTSVVCAATRVRTGTKVTLYFKYAHAGFHVLGHANFDAKGRATIVFVSKVRKETVQMWAQLANSAAYAGVSTRTVTVRMV